MHTLTCYFTCASSIVRANFLNGTRRSAKFNTFIVCHRLWRLCLIISGNPSTAEIHLFEPFSFALRPFRPKANWKTARYCMYLRALFIILSTSEYAHLRFRFILSIRLHCVSFLRWNLISWFAFSWTTCGYCVRTWTRDEPFIEFNSSAFRLMNAFIASIVCHGQTLV